MRISEVYSRSVLVTDVADTLAEAADGMRAGDVGALAVLDGSSLVGIISERDVLRAVSDRADPQRTLVGAYTTHDAISLPESADVSDAAELMAAMGIRHVPITRDGQVIGMLSVRDLLELLIERRRAVT